jgi:hypothetical protein
VFEVLPRRIQLHLPDARLLVEGQPAQAAGSDAGTAGSSGGGAVAGASAGAAGGSEVAAGSRAHSGLLPAGSIELAAKAAAGGGRRLHRLLRKGFRTGAWRHPRA